MGFVFHLEGDWECCTVLLRSLFRARDINKCLVAAHDAPVFPSLELDLQVLQVVQVVQVVQVCSDRNSSLHRVSRLFKSQHTNL